LGIDKGQDVLWINGHHHPLLDNFFKTVTYLGNGLIFLPFLILTSFIRFKYSFVVLIVHITHGLIVSIFKRILFPALERPRKFLDSDLLHIVPGVDVHGSHTFPSGHTATAFCAALLIALIAKNKILSAFALLLALLVGYSRIYLGQHFLTDVAAGAVIGCFTTYITWHAMENNREPIWMNRKINFNLRLKSRTSNKLQNEREG
jgi:membrane-associated phospholipid phosphatase